MTTTPAKKAPASVDTSTKSICLPARDVSLLVAVDDALLPAPFDFLVDSVPDVGVLLAGAVPPAVARPSPSRTAVAAVETLSVAACPAASGAAPATSAVSKTVEHADTSALCSSLQALYKHALKHDAVWQNCCSVVEHAVNHSFKRVPIMAESSRTCGGQTARCASWQIGSLSGEDQCSDCDQSRSDICIAHPGMYRVHDGCDSCRSGFPTG